MNDSHLKLLDRFVAASLEFRVKQRMIEENPELLSEDFLVGLDELIARTEISDPAAFPQQSINLESWIRLLKSNRDMLRRSAEHGVAAVFDYIAAEVGQGLSDFIATDTWEEKRPMLEASPLLISDIAEERFAAGIEAAAEANAARAVRQLKQHRDLLRRYRSDKAELLAQMDSATDYNPPEGLLKFIRRAHEAYQVYRQERDSAKLDEAVAAAEQVLEFKEFDAMLPTLQLNALDLCASIYFDKYSHSQSVDELNRLIHIHDLAVPQIHPERRSLALWLSRSGLIFFERFQLSKNVEDLNWAIFDMERSITISQSASLETAHLLSSLAEMLAKRSEVLGDDDDLDRAIHAYSAALNRTSEEEAELSERLCALGNLFFRRFERRHDVNDLDAAVNALDNGANLLQPESVKLTNMFADLANSLSARFSLKRDLDDVNRAISALRMATKSCPPDARGREVLYERLAANFRERYHITQDPNDLNDAIETLRELMRIIPDGSANIRTFLDELGSRLWDRFQHVGSLDDLDEAIEVFERAVVVTAPDALNFASALNNLAAALRDRFIQTGAPKDLDRAIELHRRAVAHTDKDSHERPAHVNNLGLALLTKAEQTDSLNDVEGAINTLLQGVGLTDPDTLDYPRHLNNLASARLARYSITQDAAHLDETIDTFTAVQRYQVAEGSKDLRYLSNLATCLKTRYGLNGNPADRDRAVECYRTCMEGWQMGSIGVSVAARIADSWGRWALERGALEEAAEAYRYSVMALRGLFRSQSLREHKEVRLGQTAGIGTRAAYALAKYGDFNGAVEAFEGGRALLLSEAMDLNRSELEGLRNDPAHKHLYEQYGDATRQLGVLRNAALRADQEATATTVTHSKSLRSAERKVNTIVEQIRRVKGYETFLQPMTAADIAKTAGEGMLVYLAATERGGVALAVDATSITQPLWLRGLTLADLSSNVRNYAEGLSRINDEPDAWFRAQEATSKWLWEVLMGELVNVLKGYPSLTLVPTGFLGLLPLHAAWTEDETKPTKRRYALDDALISYAPNARSLRAARHLIESVGSDGILVVDDPQPVSAGYLLNSWYEVNAAIGGVKRHLRLRHEEATLKAVVEAFTQFPTFHFSCHGLTDFRDPLKSRLILAYNEQFTVRDILKSHHPGARLAVLSACESAIPGIELIDEVIGLPTSLLQAGVAGVVGSLWAVFEPSTMELMVRFYNLWREGNSIPEALRRAQQQVRDTTVAQKRQYLSGCLEYFADAWTTLPDDSKVYAHQNYWAAFTHVGV